MWGGSLKMYFPPVVCAHSWGVHLLSYIMICLTQQSAPCWLLDVTITPVTKSVMLDEICDLSRLACTLGSAVFQQCFLHSNMFYPSDPAESTVCHPQLTVVFVAPTASYINIYLLM